MVKKIIWLGLLLGLVMMAGVACLSPTDAPSGAPSPSSANQVIMYEADSLMVPFARVRQEFIAANPGFTLDIQAHGSIQVIRHVTELGVPVDICAVADYSLIPMLMYQTSMDNGQPFGQSHIQFCTNKLVLVYTDKSKYAGKINSQNWYRILARPDIKFGLADPRMDAVGYRTIMAAQLAEAFYEDDTILDKIFAGCFRQGFTFQTAGGISTVIVPEVLEPIGSRLVMRGASMQLQALIESGDVDYDFEYLSVARQHGFRFIELPPEIDLSSTAHAGIYKTVRVRLDFRRFKTVIPDFEGLPIVYGLAIPENAPHRAAAVRFLQFALGPAGQKIFSDVFQPQLVPPATDNRNGLPAEFQNMVK